ncbi:MAG TPA: cysteine-rich CWC family protein [Myxococcota bacterium]|nr:cysteine-rich CWC family protein [Myxococcota bacterium]
MSEAPDPTRCPLCGDGNACTLAAGRPAERCWCSDVAISRGALARLPEGARGLACLCRKCGTEER